MKLIIINGPPGAGKSSVAEVLHKNLSPLSFFLKFDAQRRFLKDRHENRLEARALTYKVCNSIIEVCLQENKDVVFEGVAPDSAALDGFIKSGQKYNAEIFEFILWADKETILERNTNRGLPADGTPDSKEVSPRAAEKYWDMTKEFTSQRPNAHIIDVKENNLEQVINIAKALIDL